MEHLINNLQQTDFLLILTCRLAHSKRHLEPYLPSHPIIDPMALMQKRARSFGVVSAAPYGSAAILPISWAYVKVKRKGINS